MFREKIRDYYEGLTPGYRKVADYIMHNTLDVAFMTVLELSRSADVDPATVVRFAQELGYSGFKELSQEIKNDIRDRMTATYQKAQAAQTEQELLVALWENTQENMKTFLSAEMPKLVQITQILKQAPRIWVVGDMLSYDLARLLAKQFQISGTEAYAFQPSMTASAIHLSEMQAGDVLVAIAIAHFGLDTGYMVKLANEKGLTTISFSGSGTELLARAADIVVVFPIKSPTKLMSPSIPYILTSLIWEAVITHDPPRAANLFTQLYTNMGQLREMRANTEAYEISTEKM